MAGRRELTEQIVVRVEPDLLAMLREDAEANGRTIAQTVRFNLRRWYQRQGKR